MKRFKPFWILGAILLGALAFTIFGFVSMSLWNELIPDLFHGPHVSFWQMVGLLILTRILFSGLGGKRWGGRHRWHNENHWRNKWDEKLSSMTDEEKAQFRERFRCGYGWQAYKKPAEEESKPQ